jgi:pilus assembly protein CpaB
MMALLVSLVATFFLYARMKKQFNKPVTLQVVASSMGLEAGTELKPDQLVLVDWPSNLPLEGTVTKPDQIVGRILLYPIPAKEPIRDQLLAAPGAAIGLTAKIPDGMRAVAVVTNEVNNVSGFLFPGSHVDVLVTFRAEAGKELTTSTVLQNIEVLSTGERLQPDPSGKPQNVKVVTLLMSPEDAQKMSLASNEGTVQFVLRNGVDQAQPEQHPIQIRELQGNASMPLPRPRKATVVASQPSVYEVEVFDGDKKSVVKF